LEELDARLKALREETHPPEQATGATREAMSGLNTAFRIGTELVAALIVGVGAGYLLDQWLGTAPWLLITFFFLGAGAGILNVYRAASGIGTMSGLPRKNGDEPGDDGKRDPGDGMPHKKGE